MYTGTPALKTDFTRTGKRTHRGALDDGINSVTRYYINNFTDGYYHDCLDIATLKLTPSQYMRPRSHFTPLKLCFIALIIMVYLAKIQGESWLMNGLEGEWSGRQTIMHILIIFCTLFFGSYAIMTNGRKFVDDSSRYV